VSTMPLNTQPNFHAPGMRSVRDFTPGDDFYQMLIDAHRDLSAEDGARLNARLILLLANHVGDLTAIREAIGIAREGLGAGE
jgi:putative component of toxin-antitoxin plasmid stabilization module